MGDKPPVWLFLLAAACSGGDRDGAAPAGGADAGPAPTLELGSSEEAFVLLVDGGRIDTFKGTQGGFHVNLSVRTTGLVPGTPGEASRLCSDAGTFTNPCVKLDVYDLDDPLPGGRQLDAFAPLRITLAESVEQPGAYEIQPPRRVTLAITSLAQVEGHRFRIVGEVDDAAGKTARTELIVTCAPVR